MQLMCECRNIVCAGVLSGVYSPNNRKDFPNIACASRNGMHASKLWWKVHMSTTHGDHDANLHEMLNTQVNPYSTKIISLSLLSNSAWIRTDQSPSIQIHIKTCSATQTHEVKASYFYANHIKWREAGTIHRRAMSYQWIGQVGGDCEGIHPERS